MVNGLLIRSVMFAFSMHSTSAPAGVLSDIRRFVCLISSAIRVLVLSLGRNLRANSEIAAVIRGGGAVAPMISVNRYLAQRKKVASVTPAFLQNPPRRRHSTAYWNSPP